MISINLIFKSKSTYLKKIETKNMINMIEKEYLLQMLICNVMQFNGN